MDLMNLKVFSNLDDSMMYGATGQEERGWGVVLPNYMNESFNLKYMKWKQNE